MRRGVADLTQAAEKQRAEFQAMIEQTATQIAAAERPGRHAQRVRTA